MSTKNGYIRILEVGSNIELASLKEGGRFTCLAFSTDDKKIAAASWYGTIHLWNSETEWKEEIFTGHLAHVNNIAFSRDGKYIASASGYTMGVTPGEAELNKDNSVRLWNVDTKKQQMLFRGIITFY